MMACASGVWRAISSSVISSDMPFLLGKSRRLARPIPQEPPPGPWPITAGSYRNVKGALTILYEPAGREDLANPLWLVLTHFRD
jgi:hypothetical protein